jgi:hypothetical protein
MSERMERVINVLRTVAITFFVVFVIPTALGVFLILHREAALKASTAAPKVTVPDSAKARVPVPVQLPAPVKVRASAEKDTTHG